MKGQKRETAVHEAGHAALQIALGIGLQSVTIVPDAATLGSSMHGGEFGRVAMAPGEEDDEVAQLRSVAEDAFLLRHAIADYAGAEAVRQFCPRSADPEAGAHGDFHEAAARIGEITSDDESIDLYFKLAKRRCVLLVAHYKLEILALAKALQSAETLDGSSAREIFFNSLNDRLAPLLRY